MSEPRRDAWRMTREETGWLAASQFRAACTVEDISVTGARVHVSALRHPPSQLLPRELTLTTVLGGETVTVAGQVMRAESQADGLYLAIHFFDGDAAGLGWLINQAQREDMAAGLDGGGEHGGGA